MVAFGSQHFGAYAVKGRLNIRRTADETGTGKGLMFPRPGVFALVFFKGGDAEGEETCIAVGAQAQVGFVEAACAGGGGKPVSQAAGKAAVNIACIGMWVVVKID